MDFSEKIKKYRQDNNLTQDDLAETLHVSRQSVSKWETGYSYPSYEILIEIGKLLNESIDDLLSKKEIVNETIKTKNSKLRLKIILFSSIGVVVLATGISIASIVIANQAKNEIKNAFNSKEENKAEFVGSVFLPGEGLMEDFEGSFPIDDFKNQKFAGVYFKNYLTDNNSGNNFYANVVGGIGDISCDYDQDKTIINADVTLYLNNSYKTTSDFLFVDVFEENGVLTPKITSGTNVINGMGVGNTTRCANKEYKIDLNLNSFDNCETVVIKEFDNSFTQIQSTNLDSIDSNNEFKIQSETLYVVIEEGNLKTVVWNSEMSNFTHYVKKTNTYYFDNLLSFKF